MEGHYSPERVRSKAHLHANPTLDQLGGVVFAATSNSNLRHGRQKFEVVSKPSTTTTYLETLTWSSFCDSEGEEKDANLARSLLDEYGHLLFSSPS